MYQIVCINKGETDACLTIGPFESRHNAEVAIGNLPISGNYETIQIVTENEDEEEDEDD